MAPAPPMSSTGSGLASGAQARTTGTGTRSASHSMHATSTSSHGRRMTLTVTVTVRPPAASSAAVTAVCSMASSSTSRVPLLPPATSAPPVSVPPAPLPAGVRASVLGPALGGVLVGALLLYVCLFRACRRRRRVSVQAVRPFLCAAASPGAEKALGFSFGDGDVGWTRVARAPARAWLARDSDTGYLSASSLKVSSVLGSPAGSLGALRTVSCLPPMESVDTLRTPGRAWHERDADMVYTPASARPPLSALVAPKESADTPRWEETETPPDYVSTIQGLDPVKLE
ncbi:hypothetical protein HYPSUDRAFT_81082 [Hypholoma sublateritium FD-334 SS-4]|uniref:Uncharacterized protein n=1 Tax=Hypholoma sublateritium (strain FD-334 SS-4) TaxID=945553 RepID=A0A0D2KGH3_HYPSF|nr:hypothetical protein HYPSUDRAFT_81082 [Hypholoma sublateritium FD-334 SS-4]